jgi:hypothetical protein
LLAWTKIPHVRGVPQRAQRIPEVVTLRFALQTLPRDIRGNNLKPDSETFLCLLDACSSLLPSGDMQTKDMEHLASEDLYTRLVVENSEFDSDGTHVVPLLSWISKVTTACHILERKEGPALDVAGDFFLTGSMKERRMRRLRERRNQKLLRGGRLTTESNMEGSARKANVDN